MEPIEFRRTMKVIDGYGKLRRGTVGLAIITGVGFCFTRFIRSFSRWVDRQVTVAQG